MHSPNTKKNERIADIIENRSPAGKQEAVQGWHNLLKKLLHQMAPYLREGQLVTFRTLKEPEKAFFKMLHRQITIPDSAGAIFIPPSVLFQMLYRQPESSPPQVPGHSLENPPDDGIILASRLTEFNVVVNVLFARPPFAPAIDIYEIGQLLAGYVYNNIDECLDNLTQVLQTHLQSSV